MSKIICKIIIIVMVILAIIIGIMYLIDLDRMKKGKEVVFSTWGAKYAPILPDSSNENNEKLNTNNTENYQKYSKTIDNIKIELNIPNEWKYKEVPRDEENDFYKYALKLYKNNENQYAMLYFYNSFFGVCGTGRTSKNITLNNGKEAIIGYYYGDKNWCDISFYNINEYIAVMNYDLIDTDADEVIEFIKTINITNEENEYSFFGKVIESTANYIIVEPNEDEEVRKSSDKISIGLGEYNDALYMVGTNVKITYDGTIMESYPAQVKAIKIEVKSAENFEIRYYDKHPQWDENIHIILDKSETDKYDYNIFACDGSVNILINGEETSLRNALLENKITMEEIISKANEDFPNAISYDDGGSIEYHYENYTIIKCHTIDGNRDVYIGDKDLKLNDII